MSFREELKVCGTFYLLTILGGLSLMVLPFAVIYLLEIGLSQVQVGLVFSATFISMLVFEIPTGAIADHFGRKTSAVIACFALAPIYLGIGAVSSFIPMLFLWALHGVAATFWSGAFEAWFIDTVKHHKLETNIHRYLARNASLEDLASLPAYILGSLILIYGLGTAELLPLLRVMWYAMTFFTIVCGLVALAGEEPYFKPKKLRVLETFKETFKTSREGVLFVLGHTNVFKLTLAAIFGAYVFELLYISWQPYFRDHFGLDPMYFGFIMAAGNLLAIAALNSSERLALVIGHKRDFLLWTVSLATIAMSTYAFGDTLAWVVASYMLFWMFRRLSLPAQQAYYNEFVPSRIRATVGSVSSMGQMVGRTAGVLLGYGLVSEWFGLRTAISLVLVVGLLELVTLVSVRK